MTTEKHRHMIKVKSFNCQKDYLRILTAFQLANTTRLSVNN